MSGTCHKLSVSWKPSAAERAMPDGDRVHGGLNSLYRKPYKILCEGVANDEECAHSLLEGLKKDLQKKGMLPLLLCHEIADQLSQTICPLGLSNQDEWRRINSEVDELVQRADGPPNLKELFLRGAKSVLHSMRYGHGTDVDMETCLFKQYIHEVYDSEFKGRVPLSSDHDAGVAPESLRKRIEAIQSPMDSGIEKFAQAAIRNHSLDRLPLQRRHLRAEIDLNENLLAC